MLYQARGIRDSSSTNFVCRGSEGAIGLSCCVGWPRLESPARNGSLARGEVRLQHVFGPRGPSACRLRRGRARTPDGGHGRAQGEVDDGGVSAVSAASYGVAVSRGGAVLCDGAVSRDGAACVTRGRPW